MLRRLCASFLCLCLLSAGCEAPPEPESPMAVHLRTPVPFTPSSSVSPAPAPPKTAPKDNSPDLDKLVRFETGRRLPPPVVGITLQPTGTATDLPAGAAPLDGTAVVRQKTLRPLSPSVTKEDRLWAQDVLTFDPRQTEGEYTARCAVALDAIYYRDHDFATVDAIADTLRSKRFLNPSGSWMLSLFYKSFTSWETPADRPEDVELAEAWLRNNPQSSAARFVLGTILTERAWDARGGGLAKDVDKTAWPLFQERLQKARQVLEEGKDSGDPYLSEPLLRALMGLQAEDAPMREALARVWKVDQVHVWGGVRAYTQTLLPRWGGSREAYRKFLDEEVQRTRARLGQGAYALLAGSMLGDPLIDQEVAPDWKRVSQGYRDLLARYPHSEFYLTAAIATAVENGQSNQLAWLKREFDAGRVGPPLTPERRKRILKAFQAKRKNLPRS